MIDRDDEWAGWKRDFERGASAIDAPAIRARVRRETNKLRASVALEVGASALVVGFYAVLIVRGADAPIVALASVSFVFVAVWLGYLLHVLRATWRAGGSTVKDALDLTLARRRAEVRWYAFARWATIAFTLAATAWAPFMLSAGREVYAREPWRAVVGFGGIYLIAGLLLWLMTRRRARARREAAALAATVRALGE